MDADAHHGPSLGVYFAVFGTLVVLTGVTVAVAFADLGALNHVVMLGIAVTKATLVVLFFMHGWYGPRLNLVLAVCGFAWLAILIAFTLSDVLMRRPEPRLGAGAEGGTVVARASGVRRPAEPAPHTVTATRSVPEPGGGADAR